GTSIRDGSNISAVKSPTQKRAIAVKNWNVRLVGIDEGKIPVVLQVEVHGEKNRALNRGHPAAGRRVEKVLALERGDEPANQVQQYAQYTLTVNGVLQPGGTPAQ